ncbi:MAG: Maf family nucleotide pyrophosphatase [Rikenellaceae bacterium]
MALEQRVIEHGWNILLASQSPRRQELLSGCGVPFTTIRFEVDESYPEDIKVEDVPEYLSKIKSQGYPNPVGVKDIVITADTVVISGDKILGKPKDREDAISMLSALSGESHRVITGVTLRTHNQTISFSSESRVKFTSLTQEQIEYYIDRYRPFDKAGSYGCQEWIGYVAIENIEGSFYNIMGLPTDKLYYHIDRLVK